MSYVIKTTSPLKELLKLLIITGVFFLFSCENDIERINLLTNPEELPDIQGKNMDIIYSDSGIVKARMVAETIKQYSRAERPYILFPDGLKIFFFNSEMEYESELTADYAIYYNEEKFWNAKGNVIAENHEKSEKLNTEELFWDEKSKKIYSNSFSRIENKDGTFYGQNGFEANQKFTNWKLKGSRGTIHVKDEPTDSENP